MKILKLFLSSLFAFQFTVSTGWSGNCGENQNIDRDAIRARNSVKLNTPIFFFDKQGRFFRTKFNEKSQELISNHGDMTGNYFLISPNGKYIIYSSTGKKDTYFLYNTKTKREKTLFQTPAYDLVSLGFSPDSKKLAILNVMDPHRQPLNREGVFVFDLEKSYFKFFHYPKSAKIKQINVLGSELLWSRSGKEIYLDFNDHTICEHYSLNLEKGTYQHIKGISVKQDSIQNDKNFTKDIYTQKDPQSNRWFDSLSTINNKLIVLVNNKHELVVKQENKKSIVISKGYYDICIGVTVRLISLLYNNYVIYQNEEMSYIYDIKEGKKYLLFDSKIKEYLWSDALDTRQK